MIHLADADALAFAALCPLHMSWPVAVSCAISRVDERLGHDFGSVWPLLFCLFAVHPHDAAQIARVGEIRLAAMRIVKQTIPVPTNDLEFRVGAFGPRLHHQLEPAEAFDQHVFPNARERLVKIRLVFDEPQRVGCGAGCLFIVRRARHSLGIGAIARLIADQIIDLRLDAIDHDIRLIALLE